MSDRRAYEALSSTSRLEILRLLRKKHLSVDEIAELINLQPISVRHHLQSLEDAGFIESYEKKSGTVGRPKIYYHTPAEPKVVGYPKRRYLTLSNFVIRTLPKFIGSERTLKLLKRVGKNMGKNVIKEIESRPYHFEQATVDYAINKLGISPTEWEDIMSAPIKSHVY